jgi:hypothetical protein
MSISIFDLPSANLRKLLVPTTDLTPSNETSTSGIAFSTDGSKIAALFEQDSAGLLVVFSTGRAAKQPLLHSQVLPTIPSRPQNPFAGSSVLWLTNDALLLYGRSVLSSRTGAEVGDLGVLSVAGQTFLKADVCELNVQSLPSLHGVAIVKLKMDEIAKVVAGK